MKKLKLLLVFVVIFATLLITSCTGVLNTCTIHRDLNKDDICDACGSEMPVKCPAHKDLDHDGMCDTEGCPKTFKVKHYDDDHDGKCDQVYCNKTGLSYKHEDEDYDRKCDGCGKEMNPDCEECYDGDGDGRCDECNYPIIICNHVDENGDDECDLCLKPMPVAPVCNHMDGDKDGLCDMCREPMANTIPLVTVDGTTAFKFVNGKGISGSTKKKIDSLVNELAGLGVITDVNSGDEVEYEILIGEVAKRDPKYTLDPHDYGMKGYTIQIIDKKIIVVAGSAETLPVAIDALRTEIFRITDKVVATGKLSGVYLYPDQQVTVVQENYDVSLITLFGQDIRDYRMAYNHSDSDASIAAAKIQQYLYEKTGYWLDSLDTTEAVENAINIIKVAQCGETGFSAVFDENKIVFTSEYATTLEKVPYDFFVEAIEGADKELKTLALSDADESYIKFTRNAHYVYYDDFGAVGDGTTNDADAIYEAHQFAYRGKHKKIVGTSGKNYLIGNISAKAAAPIYCDVDWTGVKFTLDDREGVITNGYRDSIFAVTGASYSTVRPANSAFLKEINANGGFKAADMVKFDLGLGYAAMLKVTNGNHKNFIREGVNANSGTTQTEVILIDAEGNIDPKVRFLFDYEQVTAVNVYRVDTVNVKPITIEGGEFTTIAHNQTAATSYTGQRGISVKRHHVTIKNLKHYVTGEPTGDIGSAYPNFIDVNSCYNVLVEDCVFTGRKTYYNIKGTSRVGQGTYDITTHGALEVTWKNCTQSNFYNDPTDPTKGRPSQFWGINGGGESKRVTYDGCTLSRFDAHTGIMHAYIINSTVGSVDLTGGGNLHIINSMVYGSPMIRFREDYGAFWIGDVVIKDSAIVENNSNTIETACVFNNSWVNHYFGYETSMPQSIIIDNLRVLKKDEKTLSPTAKTLIFFASSFINNSDNYNKAEYRQQQSDGSYAMVKNKNIMTPPGSIVVRNNTQGLKIDFSSLQKKSYFADTKMEELPITNIPECTAHKDEDANFVCDECWAYIPASVCRIHPDTDHDGYCDVLVCKTKLEEQ